MVDGCWRYDIFAWLNKRAISKAGYSLVGADPMRLHIPNEQVKSQGYKACRGYGYCHGTRSIAGRILGFGLPHVLADKGDRHFYRDGLASAAECHQVQSLTKDPSSRLRRDADSRLR